MFNILYIFLVLLLPVSPCRAAASDGCPHLALSSAEKRVTNLREEISYHNDLYYNKQHPTISDAQYDTLFDELVQLEQCFPSLSVADSPSSTVGSESASQVLSLRHDRPMLSLSSSTGPEAVEALLNRVRTDETPTRFLVQPKVDGLPVELIYLSGRLVSASTRGDGLHGEDVTQRVKKITGVPLTLSGTFPARVTVRGEIYADLGLMAAAASSSAVHYATPRHLAAGTLKSQAPPPLALATLRLFPFELVNADGGLGVTTDLAALGKLVEWGFPARVDMTRQVETLEQIHAAYEKNLTNRGEFPFAADGIVVKVNDLALRRRLGEGTRAPYWAAAWKFPPATASTIVLGIRWQVGRTGRRTPVAEVEPVNIGGVWVRHVSLQNAETAARLGIAVGDRVKIALVADIIPQVLEVKRKGPNAAHDRASAQQMLAVTDACLRDAPGCRSQFLARAAYFVSRSGLNIPGLGRGRLQKLVEAGLVRDLPSLFRLKPQELAAVSGFGGRSARRLTGAIRKVGHPQPFRMVLALGIPGIGPVSAEHLARQFSSLDALLNARDEDGSSGESAKSVRDFFGTPGGRELFIGFRELGLF